MANTHLQKSEIDKDALFERVIDTVNAALKDTIHIVEGAPQAQLLQNGAYKTNTVFGDQELFFKDIRVGKSGKIIFSFTPTDAMPWEQCEWNAVKLDEAVPLFGAAFAEALKLEGEHLPTLLTNLIAKTEALLIEEEKQAVVEAAKLHESNPKFGRF